MPAGRPTKMTPETLEKLDQAFLLGCTDEEACLAANISVDTLYLHQRENPEYIKRKEQLKQNPFLIARTSIVSGLKRNPDLSLRYMSVKKKDEFSTKTEVEHSGEIKIETVSYANTQDSTSVSTETLPGTTP